MWYVTEFKKIGKYDPGKFEVVEKFKTKSKAQNYIKELRDYWKREFKENPPNRNITYRFTIINEFETHTIEYEKGKNE